MNNLQLPENNRRSSSIDLPDFGGFLSDFEGTLLNNPDVSETIRELILQGRGIDTAHATDATTIDLEAWKEETQMRDKMKLYFKAFASSFLFDKIQSHLPEVTRDKLSLKAPTLENFMTANVENIISTSNRNVIVSPGSQLEKLSRQGADLIDIVTGQHKNTEDENKKFVQKFIAEQWPLGSTVVMPHKKKSGEKRNITIMRQLIELTGVDVATMSANDGAISNLVGENEINLVLIPESIMNSQTINSHLNVLDNLGKLYERGNAVWYEPELVAAVLVRSGITVEDALQSVGFKPSLLPAQQAEYQELTAVLNTITVQGEAITELQETPAAEPAATTEPETPAAEPEIPAADTESLPNT